MMSLLVAAAVTCSASAFVDSARAGTDKYCDQAVAIRDGYRRIGRDFPAMGEHWIRLNLVFDGRFDPSRPEVLNYIVIDGKPRLLGVGYAVPLLGGESAPSGPAGADAWHDHFRTVEDETVLPHHHTHGSAGADARLAMLHAWIWSPNPAGMFAADNWAIPFLRHNLDPVPDAAPSVAKALALVGGGRDYFEMAIDAGAALTVGEKTRVSNAMDQAQAEVEQSVARFEGRVLGESECTTLTGIWTRLWSDIDAAISPEARQKLAHLPVR